MRSVDEYLAHIRSFTTVLGSEPIAVAEAAGRVVVHDVRAAVSVPVFDNSAMDGYAVHYQDVGIASETAPVALRVVADLPAGTHEHPMIEPGQAARIMTGAPFPQGADTVVPVEDTDGGTNTVMVRGAKSSGVHVRFAGEDMQAGDVVVPRGTRLGALELSAIASVGVSEVQVSRRPRIAVVSTGSELVESGQPLDFGQIPESNSILVAALAAEAGAEIVFRGTVTDDVRELLAQIDSLPQVDAVVLSGGVSVGAYDVVKAAFEPRGEIEFTTVAMQPGKPQGFGRLADGPLVFCLPGNPVSAAVSFETFVRPAFERMTQEAVAAVEWAVAGATWRARPGRRLTIPVLLTSTPEGGLLAHPANVASGMGSHRSATLAKVQGWVIVPAGVDQVNEGDVVQVRRR